MFSCFLLGQGLGLDLDEMIANCPRSFYRLSQKKTIAIQTSECFLTSSQASCFRITVRTQTHWGHEIIFSRNQQKMEVDPVNNNELVNGEFVLIYLTQMVMSICKCKQLLVLCRFELKWTESSLIKVKMNIFHLLKSSSCAKSWLMSTRTNRATWSLFVKEAPNSTATRVSSRASQKLCAARSRATRKTTTRMAISTVPNSRTRQWASCCALCMARKRRLNVRMKWLR